MKVKVRSTWRIVEDINIQDHPIASVNSETCEESDLTGERLIIEGMTDMSARLLIILEENAFHLYSLRDRKIHYSVIRYCRDRKNKHFMIAE